MAEAGVRINWGATGPADLVAASRRPLPAGGCAVCNPQTPVRAAQPAIAGAPAKMPKVSRLKKLRAIGEAAGMPAVYALATLVLAGMGVVGVWRANVAFAPEMYNDRGLVPAVKAFQAGQNYAVFDLNFNIRKLREHHVAGFTKTPEVVLIGASQWQEAHAGLMQSRRMYNGHIHRDYWEDLLGAVEVYARSNRLPKQMIIAIRDKQFTPLALRKDFLWEPGIPSYQAMAARLGIEPESKWKTLPFQRIRERLSLTMLFNNVTRWFNSAERPHATAEKHFAALDTLLPDGSILWSAQHKAVFTPERATHEALALAEANRDNPPVIDPQGIAAFDKLLTFLEGEGTEVTLVHPPFNPVYWKQVQGGTYTAGLNKVRQVTADLAAKHGLNIIGDFDPAKVGCNSAMYIDAEHSNPDCVGKIMRQFDSLNRAADEIAAKAVP